MPVKVVHWNPRVTMLPSRLSELAFWASRKNNFGDLLGPLVVEKLLALRSIPVASGRRARLLSVGSIIHLSQDGDTVWGTGVNGKMSLEGVPVNTLDIRAVRGPLTREVLGQYGADVPEIFGDPALLLPALFPELVEMAHQKQHKLAVIPNLNETTLVSDCPDYVNPRGDTLSIVRRLITSEKIVSSSLHGIIIAEAFGVPCTFVQPRAEPLFKYRDYFAGTGRSDVPVTQSFGEAVTHNASTLPELTFSNENLIAAFPYDLWKN